MTVDELVDDVGADVFRFFMIERKPDGHLDFDLDLAKDKNWRKNPAYYVQYAHARTHGIERKAKEESVAMPAAHGFDAGRLDLEEEIAIVKKLATFPEIVARAAESREPHHVAYYLREVAGLWNPYLQDGGRHRVISEDAELTAARLGLALAIRNVLASGLGLLGISAPERNVMAGPRGRGLRPGGVVRAVGRLILLVTIGFGVGLLFGCCDRGTGTLGGASAWRWRVGRTPGQCGPSRRLGGAERRSGLAARGAQWRC